MGVSEHLEPKQPTEMPGWQRSCSQSPAFCVKLSENPAAYEVKARQASLSFRQTTFLCFSGIRAPREDISYVSRRL